MNANYISSLSSKEEKEENFFIWMQCFFSKITKYKHRTFLFVCLVRQAKTGEKISSFIGKKTQIFPVFLQRKFNEYPSVKQRKLGNISIVDLAVFVRAFSWEYCQRLAVSIFISFTDTRSFPGFRTQMKIIYLINN